jgi:hypothetical protein
MKIRIFACSASIRNTGLINSAEVPVIFCLVKKGKFVAIKRARSVI